jgi:diguanylate cyclase (GGDEF)-like protein
LQILDAEPPDGFLRICQVASDRFDVPIAFVALVDDQHQWLKATIGIAAVGTARADAIGAESCCDDFVVVEDARADRRLRRNPFVAGAPFIRFYASAPISLGNGYGLGMLAIADTAPRAFDEGQRQRLRRLADATSDQLKLHAATAYAQAEARRAQASEARLRWLAEHDLLTGLANRSLLQARLSELVGPDRTAGVALLLVDLDDFKAINDTWGHDAGDAWLRTAAKRLIEAAGPEAMVGRLGGDELAVILPAIGERDAVATMAERLNACLSEPFTFDAQTVSCSASIGIALFPGDAEDSAALLKSADLALYAAKSRGRRRVVFFSVDMRDALEQRVSVVTQTRRALANDEFVAYYQPIVQIDDGAVSGFEALLRWRHPEHGLIGPAALAGAFDDEGLGFEIGKRMLDCIIKDACRWRDAGVPFERVGLNLSQAEFRNPALVEHVLSRLAEAQLAPQHFLIEVTESTLLGRDPDTTAQKIKILHDNGILIALDDFGTGFASLTHLKQFPVDIIKIDRSFVRDFQANASDRAIVGAVIGLGRDLGMRVIAEGIETTAQLEALRREGCRLGQGYLFSKAMAGSRVPHFLRTWEMRRAAVLGMPDQAIRDLQRTGT